MGSIEDDQVAIAGGGPAGLMLGYLLARAGLRVTVVEEHADFLRDFRGDTIHPSTMEAMARLGLLPEFLKLPHEKVERLMVRVGDARLEVADFTRLPVAAPFIAMMPQWNFLEFLARRSSEFPCFRLLRSTEATGLIEAEGRVAGPTAETPGETNQTQGRFEAGRIVIAINRGNYWQCAYVVPKDGYSAIRAEGLERFRTKLGPLLPFDAARVAALQSWDDLKLLVVQVNRLKRWWRPGFLAIGDAAHAMSPVGGVGVNLAVADAIAAANRLVPLIGSGAGPELAGLDAALAAIETRRVPPTRTIQRIQVFAQSRILAPALGRRDAFRAPLPLRIAAALPLTRRFVGRLVGIGPQPEYPDPAVFG